MQKSHRTWAAPRVVASLLVLLLVPAALAAITGSMSVVTSDTTGAPLPGVTVTLKGSGAEGERTAVTNEKGVAQFNALPPGDYNVQATLTGFNASAKSVHVSLERNVLLKLQLLEQKTEVVTVTATPPTVDTTSTTTGQELSRTMVDSMPIGRDYLTNLSRVPGVGTGANPSVRGATDRENLYLIDGVNTTDPVTSTFGTNVNFDIIDQQNVTTGGLGAEYGGISGMVSNLITKSGGNEWSGTVSYFRQDPKWEASAKPGSSATTSALTYDYSYTLGGPILKDRLWHFTSYKKNRTEIVSATDDNRDPRIFDGYLPFAKLTWQVTQNHRLQAIYNQENTKILNVNANDVTITQDQFYNQDQPAKLYTMKYQGLFGANVILEGQANFVRNNLDAYPAHYEAGPSFSSPYSPSGVAYGRYANEQYSKRNRDEFKLDLSWIVPSSFGDHNLKFGAGYNKTEFSSINMVSGGVGYTELPAYYHNLGYRTPWSWIRATAGYNQFFWTWVGLGRLNPDFNCQIAGVPCSEYATPADVDPALFTAGHSAYWTMGIGESTYNANQMFFDSLSLNPQAAADGTFYSYLRNTADRPESNPSGNRALSLYGQDEWRYDKFTVRIGARFDRQEFKGSDGRTVFKFKNIVSPRLGISYDVKGDGRQKIWGNYGVLYDALNDESADFVGNINTATTSGEMWIGPLGEYRPYGQTVSGGAPGALVAPNIRNPKTNELMLGYARDLGHQLSVELTGFYRKTTDLIEDWDVLNGRPDQFTTPTLAQLGFKDVNGDGTVDTTDLPATLYSSNGNWYVLYNPPGAERKAYGADLVVNKRFSDRWQAMFSYSWQKAQGNLATAFLARTVGDDPYLDPRFSYNYGDLSYARNHFIQLMGSYTFPFRLTVGAELRVTSGFPYSLSVTDGSGGSGIWNGDPSLIVNTLPINREDLASSLGMLVDDPGLDAAIVKLIPLDLRAGRGAYRNPWETNVNLRLRYDLPIHKSVNAQFFLDVFRLLNKQKETTVDGSLNAYTEIDSTNIGDRSNYSFQQTLATQSPRSLQLGVRVQF